MNKKFFTGLAAALLVGALSAAPALAGPRFWTDKTKTTLLRDVTTAPEHQPDAAEFANNGEVTLKTSIGTITCTEIEFGTTVLGSDDGSIAGMLGGSPGASAAVPIVAARASSTVSSQMNRRRSRALGGMSS